jgi:hypothetical protein
MEPVKKQPEREAPRYGSSECGAQHTECPNTWKGTCKLEVGHPGSHLCSQCNSMY